MSATRDLIAELEKAQEWIRVSPRSALKWRNYERRNRSMTGSKHSRAPAPEAVAWWHVGKWGNGTSCADESNIFCDAWETAIAENLPTEIAEAIVEAHNAALSQSHPAPSGQAVAGKHKWAPIMDGTLCCQYCMIDQAASTSDECSKAPRTVTHPAPSGQLVKALEWREHPKKSNGCWTADSPFGTYSVVNEGGWWCVLEDGPFGKGFEWLGNDLSKDTLETAKAAAQADYERRIRSALAPTEEARALAKAEAPKDDSNA